MEAFIKALTRNIPLLVTIVGILLFVGAAFGKITYQDQQLVLQGSWRYAVAGLGLCLTVLGLWQLSRAPQETGGNTVHVDLTSIPGAKEKSLNAPLLTTVDDLLDKIFIEALRPVVTAHSYGRDWVLSDAKTGKLFSEMGSAWAKARGHDKDLRPLPDVRGISGGMRLRVITPKEAITIEVGPFLGGDQEPRVFGYWQITTVGNFLNRVKNELLPKQTVREYGVRWILYDPIAGEYFKNLAPDDNRPLQSVLKPQTLLHVVTPEPEPMIPDEPTDLPEPLHQPILVRLNSLSSSQKALLDYIREHERGGGVRQDLIEKQFKELADDSSIYYRLETLYLLGLVAKKYGGKDEDGLVRYLYELAQALREALGVTSDSRRYDNESPSAGRRRSGRPKDPPAL